MEYYETTVTEQPARQPVPIRLQGVALTLGAAEVLESACLCR